MLLSVSLCFWPQQHQSTSSSLACLGPKHLLDHHRQGAGLRGGPNLPKSKTSRGWPLGNHVWRPSESSFWGGHMRKALGISKGIKKINVHGGGGGYRREVFKNCFLWVVFSWGFLPHPFLRESQTVVFAPLFPKGNLPFSGTGKPPLSLSEVLLFLQNLQHESTVFPYQERGGKTGREMAALKLVHVSFSLLFVPPLAFSGIAGALAVPTCTLSVQTSSRTQQHQPKLLTLLTASSQEPWVPTPHDRLLHSEVLGAS